MLTEAQKKELRKERDLKGAVRDAIMQAAVRKHKYDGTLEIDDNAVISMGEGGAYVQAWVYVEAEEAHLPDDYQDPVTGVWDWPSDCANPVTLNELEEALRALLKQFKLIHSPAPFYQAAREAAILLARVKGVDPIEDQTCYLLEDL